MYVVVYMAGNRLKMQAFALIKKPLILQNIFHQSRVAIQCVVCNDVVLCPDCFAAKSDIGNHSPTHPYKLLDNGGFHLFHTEWTSGYVL